MDNGYTNFTIIRLSTEHLLYYNASLTVEYDAFVS